MLVLMGIGYSGCWTVLADTVWWIVITTSGPSASLSSQPLTITVGVDARE